jgi:hypothetical protein
VRTVSARTASDGRCQQLVQRETWRHGCPEDQPTQNTLASARKVYRPAGAPPPPAGTGPHFVVTLINNNANCP